jgi:hypothetical protein
VVRQEHWDYYCKGELTSKSAAYDGTLPSVVPRCFSAVSNVLSTTVFVISVRQHNITQDVCSLDETATQQLRTLLTPAENDGTSDAPHRRPPVNHHLYAYSHTDPPTPIGPAIARSPDGSRLVPDLVCTTLGKSHAVTAVTSTCAVRTIIHSPPQAMSMGSRPTTVLNCQGVHANTLVWG